MFLSHLSGISRLCVLLLLVTSAWSQDTLLISDLKKDRPLWQYGKGSYLHSFSSNPAEVMSSPDWKPLISIPKREKNGHWWLHLYLKNDLADSAFVDFVAIKSDSVLLYTANPNLTISQISGPFIKPYKWIFPEYPELVYVLCAPGETREVLVRLTESRGRPFTPDKFYIQSRFSTLREVVDGYRTFTPRTEFNGFFLGAVSVMMIIFFFLYFRINEKSLLIYAIYLIGVICYALVVKTLPYSQLAKLSFLNYELTYKLGEPIQYFFFAAYAWFGRHLLDIDQRYKTLYHFMRTLTLTLVVSAFLLLLINLTSFNYLLQEKAFIVIRIILFPIALILIIWISLIVKSPLKWFFIAGSTFFIAGGLVAFLMDPKSRHLFFGDTYISPIIAFKSGILMESLCFALALSHKLRLIRIEKDNATDAYIEQMELNRQLVATENERLEKMVKERAAEIIEKNTLLENQRQERLQSEFEKQLAEMEMQALRSQMNPHFIFNSLNSIRHQILTKKYDSAGDYLMRFAKLLRHILQNSRQHVIPLSEETELIRLYLQLEQLRFGDLFEYDLLIDQEIDLDSIIIPSMLLQPYVENAIKHGISVSQRLPRRIVIRISEDDAGFRYEIEDNGIGREAASKNTSPGGKSGLGLKITHERIALFNSSYKQRISVIFEDLLNNNQEPVGTKVIITHSSESPANL